MEFFKSFPMLCLFAATCQFGTAYASEPTEAVLSPKYNGSRDCMCCVLRCQLGTSSFSVMDPLFWYTIDAPAYPDTMPLSMNQNYGSTQGDVELTSTGLTLGAPGNYSVSFSAIVQNPNPESIPLLSVFLVKNDLFVGSRCSAVEGRRV